MADIDFREVLRGGRVLLHPKSDTKDEIIVELIDAMADGNLVRDRDRTLAAVMKRERTMSTGMQHGVAIPHAKTDTVDEIATAIAVKKEGMDFDSLDGQPSTIFIMTVSSVLRTGPHMQYLAEIGRLMESPAIRERVLNAATEDEVVEILTG